MKNIIRMMSSSSGYFAAELAPGDFSIFEVLGLEVVELGDVLSGDLTHPGLGLLRNESKCENLNVDIRECHCSPWQADKLLNQH